MSILSYAVRMRRKAHITSVAQTHFEGERSQQANNKRRLIIMMGAFGIAYLGIAARMVEFGFERPLATASVPPANQLMASRPTILDRNGEILAMDINTVSMFAEPNKIIDPDEALEGIRTVLPDINGKEIFAKLTSDRQFEWLRRQLTPKQESQILALGIPGLGFRPEKRRFYPEGPAAAHVVGYVNIDNRGVVGMERYIDNQGFADLTSTGLTTNTDLEPVRLSIDLRVQNIVHEVIADAMVKDKAIAAGAVVLDARTGEVMAMASVPDFDPNNPAEGREDGWLNRMTNGTYEMGSTFKSFTLAMGLDDNKITLNDSVDARYPIRMGGFTIKDFHGQHRFLTVPEVFQYSSNIGTAKIVDLVGIDEQKKYLTELGLLTKMQTELPEVKTPSQPAVWKKINSVTISFGHGVSTTPLQTAVAGAALLNGGRLVEPTFLPRTAEEADRIATTVLKDTTSRDMRYLFDFNGRLGSGRNALVPGFEVGGKTGTAEKVVNGRYSNSLNFNVFLAGFPIDNPRYVILSFVDAPQDGEHGLKIAAGTAAPIVREIVSRAGALLGVKPIFGKDESALLTSF